MSDRNLNRQDSRSERQLKKAIDVKWAYRWDIYRRLKALEIDCQCSTNEPLLVNLDSPTTLVQIWSVIKQSNAERQQLIDWLDGCWKLKYKRNKK